VAGYIAKYATKAAETAGSTPRPIKKFADLDYLRLPPHTERMIRACFMLAAMPAFKDMGLYRTARMLATGATAAPRAAATRPPLAYCVMSERPTATPNGENVLACPQSTGGASSSTPTGPTSGPAWPTAKRRTSTPSATARP
jgi:hypothetical protein